MTHAQASLPGLFDHFHAARRKPSAKAIPLLTGCALLTATMLFVMWARAIWTTEQLDRPKLAFDLAIAPPQPPAPPPLAGGKKPAVVVPTPKITVQKLVQVKREPPPAREIRTEGPPGDDSHGCPSCPGTTPGGPETGDPPLPPPIDPTPTPPAPPKGIAPAALEAQRVAGEKLIVPDDVTKTEIQRAGKNQLTGTYKLCLDATGNVTNVQQLRSTGFSAYDNKIVTTIRTQWRYRPFLVDGRATPVCTAVIFKYSQQ
jgi:hypothetical protein